MSAIEKTNELSNDCICRMGDLCAGEIIHIGKPVTDIYDKSKMHYEELIHNLGHHGRKVLFTINSKGEFNDILFNSPNYKFYDTTENTGYNSIVVGRYKSLRDLLIYLGSFNEFLTEKDIKRIYRTILSNPELLSRLIKEFDNGEQKNGIYLPNRGIITNAEITFSSNGLLNFASQVVTNTTERKVKPDLETLKFLHDLCNLNGRPSFDEIGFENKRVKEANKGKLAAALKEENFEELVQGLTLEEPKNFKIRIKRGGTLFWGEGH